jgi:hypothetical protein
VSRRESVDRRAGRRSRQDDPERRTSPPAADGLAGSPAKSLDRPERVVEAPGDTVNTASRMQSSGVPGRIQVAQSTRDLLRDDCAFEEREPVEVKGLGPMTTYLLAEPVRA